METIEVRLVGEAAKGTKSSFESTKSIQTLLLALDRLISPLKRSETWARERNIEIIDLLKVLKFR